MHRSVIIEHYHPVSCIRASHCCRVFDNRLSNERANWRYSYYNLSKPQKMIFIKSTNRIAVIILTANLPGGESHGYLKSPRSRNYHASVNPVWYGGCVFFCVIHQVGVFASDTHITYCISYSTERLLLQHLRVGK